MSRRLWRGIRVPLRAGVDITGLGARREEQKGDRGGRGLRVAERRPGTLTSGRAKSGCAATPRPALGCRQPAPAARWWRALPERLPVACSTTQRLAVREGRPEQPLFGRLRVSGRRVVRHQLHEPEPGCRTEVGEQRSGGDGHRDPCRDGRQPEVGRRPAYNLQGQGPWVKRRRPSRRRALWKVGRARGPAEARAGGWTCGIPANAKCASAKCDSHAIT